MISFITTILKNPKLIMGIAIALLILACVFTMKKNCELKQDNERLENNQIAFTQEIETYKTKDGKNAAKVRQLELTVDEFKNTCSDQEEIIKNLGIKVKRLESITSTGTSTETGGKTKLKDTVFVDRIDTLFVEKKGKHFDWSDPWNKITGDIIGDEVDCRYNGVDTITTVAHRVPKKFLFFKWGTKYIEIDIANRNPSTKITYNKTIKIKK